MKRRSFLQGTLAGSALAMAAGTGYLKSAEATAAVGPVNAFAARSEAEALRALFGDAEATPSDAVRVKAPYVAMRGKGVPVKVWCAMDNVEVIAVVAGNNRYPLTTLVKFTGADAYYSTRIRIEQTSPVTAYVKVGSRLYSASTTIRVTRGGFWMG